MATVPFLTMQEVLPRWLTLDLKLEVELMLLMQLATLLLLLEKDSLLAQPLWFHSLSTEVSYTMLVSNSAPTYPSLNQKSLLVFFWVLCFHTSSLPSPSVPWEKLPSAWLSKFADRSARTRVFCKGQLSLTTELVWPSPPKLLLSKWSPQDYW